MRSSFEENEHAKIFDIADFGYWTITVERPLLDADGQIVTDSKGRPKPDAKLRDTENVSFTYDGGIDGYFKADVLPHVPDVALSTHAGPAVSEVDGPT